MTIYTTPEAFEDLTPSFGQNLGQQFSQGISSGLQLLAQDRINKMKHDRLKSLLGELGSSQPHEGEYSPQELVVMEQLIPGSAKIFQESQKVQREERKAKEAETKSLEGLQSAVNDMTDLIKFTGPIKYAKSFSPEVREKRQMFDSLAIALEKQAAGMVGKGTLSKPRFEFLMKTLPSSKKTQAANRGALKAWSQVLGVDFPGTLEDESVSETIELKKVEPGTPVTEEVVMELKRRGLSQSQAKKKLKQLGYEF